MYDIYFDVQIEGSKSNVFQAISDPEKLIKWWPLRCAGKAQINEEYNFYFDPKYDWLARVVTFELDKHFHLKMTRANEDWNPTTFGFDLSNVGNGTRLSFFHVNWPERNHHYRRSAHCWALLLQGLKEFIETGKVIPFELRA